MNSPFPPGSAGPGPEGGGLPFPFMLPDDLSSLTFEELARATGMVSGFPPRTLRFRQHAEINDPALSARLDLLAAACEAHIAGGRARRGEEARRRLAANVRLLALNLYAAHRQDICLGVAIPRGKPWFQDRRRPRNPILSHAYTIEQALDTLIALGYADQHCTGSPWGGTYTPVRATAELAAFLEHGADALPAPHAVRLLRHADPIVLKAPKSRKRKPAQSEEEEAQREAHGDGAPMRFEETEETRRMRANLDLINAINRAERVGLPIDLTPEELAELARSVRGRGQVGGDEGEPGPEPEGVLTWLAQTALYRVFNNGRFDHGGRFYGAAWQRLPAAWRARLLIDGEAVAEHDYGAFHPRLALHLLDGIDAPSDPYSAIQGLPRDLAKRVVNAMLNMERGTSQPPRWFRVAEAGMPWRNVERLVRQGVSELVPHFGSGVGLRLQRIDSDIAEEIMLHFVRRGEACLGIHDSFIVRAGLGEELVEVMRCTYRRRVGFEPVIKPA